MVTGGGGCGNGKGQRGYFEGIGYRFGDSMRGELAKCGLNVCVFSKFTLKPTVMVFGGSQGF